MENNETSPLLESVDNEAQRLAAEHKSLAELRDKAGKNISSATTREDRLATGYVYEQVVKLGREHIIAAQEFSTDNLPELKELAEREAVAAGKSIVHFEEEPLFLEDLKEYRKALDQVEGSDKFRQNAPNFNFTANRARLDLLDDYIKTHNILMADLRPQDMEILAATPEWQDTARQGAHMFDDLVVDRKYGERREQEKAKRAIKAFVAEREDMDASFQAVEESFKAENRL